MKLKVNTKILLGLIAIVILTLNSCTTPATATAIIIDTASHPVNKAGITINILHLTTVIKTTSTDATGAAIIPNKYSDYPVILTATDGLHKFSSAVIDKDLVPGAKVPLTEGVIDVIKNGVNVK